MGGHAFWANDFGKRWPGGPEDAFAACGARYNYVWISPGLDLIIVQNPGGGGKVRVTGDAAQREALSDDKLEREQG